MGIPIHAHAFYSEIHWKTEICKKLFKTYYAKFQNIPVGSHCRKVKTYFIGSLSMKLEVPYVWILPFCIGICFCFLHCEATLLFLSILWIIEMLFDSKNNKANFWIRTSNFILNDSIYPNERVKTVSSFYPFFFCNQNPIDWPKITKKKEIDEWC